jgi:bifunctional ADP-heptose synthase (sugar kinase/adenylyltransferase)
MILVCGDTILDEIRECKSNKISAKAPIPVLIAKNRIFFLGAAANVVNNIKKISGKDYPCYPCYGISCKDHKNLTKKYKN